MRKIFLFMFIAMPAWKEPGTMIACYRIYNGWHCEDAIAYNYHEVRWPLIEMSAGSGKRIR